MAISYEIYLRTAEGDEPLNEQRVIDALRTADLEPAEGKLGLLELGHGRLTAEAYTGNDWDAAAATETEQQDARGQLYGINFSFPLGLPDAEGDTAVARILSVAAGLGVVAYDPQLGSQVTQADHERIIDAWRRSHDFHFDVAGNTDLGAGIPSRASPTRPVIPTRFKLMAVIALAILLVVLMVRSCVERWLEHDMYEATESSEH